MPEILLIEKLLDREGRRQEVEVAHSDAGLADRLRDLVPVPQLLLEVCAELVLDHELRLGEGNESLHDALRE